MASEPNNNGNGNGNGKHKTRHIRGVLGRIPKEIDQAKVLALAEIGCTNAEIAEALGISDDTLVRRCADILRVGRGNMTSSLRKLQFASAEVGNVQMQIWLGKQFLGQKDKQDFTTNGMPIVKVLHGVDFEAL